MAESSSDGAPPGTIAIRGLGKLYRAPLRVTANRWHRPGKVDEDDVDEDDELDEDQRDDAPVRGPSREVWGLQDLTIDVEPGSALAVLGPPGSGKSTLLKVLAGITPPTCGEARLYGHVAPPPALSLGLLQGELSGRENLAAFARFFRLNSERLDQVYDEILDFAELRRVQRFPVKAYSETQFQRFGSALGLLTKPDILLADGSLAVGDADFRRRSLALVERLVAEGMTLVLASSDEALVRRVCKTAVELKEGRLAAHGAIDEIMDPGEPSRLAPRAKQPRTRPARPSTDIDTGAGARILDAGIYTRSGEPISALRPDVESLFELVLDVDEVPVDARCIVVLEHAGETRLRLAQPEPFRVDASGSYVIRAQVPAGALPEGSHDVRVGFQFNRDGERSRVLRRRAFQFEVLEGEDDVDGTDEDDPRSTTEPVTWSVAVSDG